jgi:membrane-bound lytic murein transglycosylase B
MHIGGGGGDLSEIGNILALAVLWLGQQQTSLERQKAALEKQKSSVRRQLKMAPAESGFFVTFDPPDRFGCAPLSLMRRQALVESAARRKGLPADLLSSVIQQESGFRPCSVSEKGAMGLMQLMPATAEDLGVEDVFDPDQNVEAGASLLKSLMERYGGDLIRVLSAYNAGPAKVDAAGGLPAIPETMKYVERILAARSTNPTAGR